MGKNPPIEVIGAASMGRIPSACGMGPKVGNVEPPVEVGCFPESRKSTRACGGCSLAVVNSSRPKGESDGEGESGRTLLCLLSSAVGALRCVGGGIGVVAGVGGATGGLAGFLCGTGWKL